MIVVHHLDHSRSQRILWMLEELEIPYRIQQYQRDSKSLLAPAALKEVHPLGKAPVIVDGELTLAESGAIIEYLQETYDSAQLLKPQDAQGRIAYRYWLHYAEGSLMPPLVMKLIFSRLGYPPVPWLLRPLAAALGRGVQKNYLDKQILTHLLYLEQHLMQNTWFAGEAFSAADIQMSFPIEAIEARGGLASYPTLAWFLTRVRARPAYQRAVTQGGNFTLLR